MNDETKISGTKTVKDWKNLREKIKEKSNDDELWKQAYCTSPLLLGLI